MNNNQRKAKTISGIKWSMLSQLIVQFSNLLIGILLTRLLTPDDFGLIAMVTIFTGFLAVYQDFGLGAALIYKKVVTDIDYNTIFYTQLVLGIFLSLVLFLFSGLIASFFDESILKPIVMVTSISFIIGALNHVQFTILKKKMDFKTIFYVNTVAIVISGIVAIIMAYLGYGVWSIVAKLVLLTLVKTVLLWFLSSWKPKFIFSKSSLKEALNYSLPIVANKTIGYFMRNTDNLIIGKFLGSGALGIYSRAYSLMMLPVSQVSGILVNVLFSSFSLVNDKISIFRSNWLKVNRYLAFVLLPFSVLMILLARPFTMLVLGSQWEESIQIIQILTFAGAAQALTNSGYVFNALGETKLNFKINIFNNSMLVLAIILGVKYGIIGVAISYTIATLLFLPLVRWYFIAKKIDSSIFEIFKNINQFLLISVICGLVFFYIFKILQLSLWVELIGTPFLFIFAYLVILNMLKNNTFPELKSIILNK